jgi:hypothetical protein
MEIHQPAAAPVHARHDVGRAPVGVLHSWLVERGDLELPGDVSLFLQEANRVDRQVDAVLAGGHFPE